jgi:tumor protein p53-inducible protein 3
MKILDPLSLQIVEAEDPKVSHRKLLVEVRATGVNRADLLQRKKLYPLPPSISPVLGIEIAGIVKEIGPEVRHCKVGDRVMGLIEGGGYAQYALLEEELSLPISEFFSFEEAAAIPEAFSLAYQTFFLLGHLKPNQTILIHGGAGAMGNALIQLAHLLKGTVFTTASTPEKRAFCLSLGATEAFDYTSDWDRDLLKLTGRGVDWIVDFIGPSYFKKNMKVLTKGGTLILLGFLGGNKLEVDCPDLIFHWVTLIGSNLRTRSLEYKAALNQNVRSFILPLLEKRMLKVIVDRVFPWEQAEEAHAYIKSRLAMGKVVLTLS